MADTLNTDNVLKGFGIYQTLDGSLGMQIIGGTGIPGGDAGPQDAAPVPSLYFRFGTSEAYLKTGSANAPADWEPISTSGVQIDELSWRNEKVRFATDDTLTAGQIDITSLSDNNDMVIGDISAGEYIIGDRDGTPALFLIDSLDGGNLITISAASQALANNDTFLVQQYLPDPSGQEAQAIVHFPLASGAGVKIGDVNWNFADGINMASGYTAQNGSISSADSVNSAIEKLDGNQQDLQTLSGTAQGDVNHGLMDQGDILSDNATTNALLKEVDAELTRERGKDESLGVTTLAAISSILVDNVYAVEFYVDVRLNDDNSRVNSFKVFATHDGTSVADAANTDHSVDKVLKIGANFDYSYSISLSGTGASQALNLNISSGETNGVDVRVKKVTVI